MAYWFLLHGIQHLKWGNDYFLPSLTLWLPINQRVSSPYTHIHFTQTHIFTQSNIFKVVTEITQNEDTWMCKRDNIADFHPSTFMDILLICDKTQHQLVIRHQHFETQYVLIFNNQNRPQNILGLFDPCRWEDNVAMKYWDKITNMHHKISQEWNLQL